jgi:hypothetical protein
MSFCPVHLLVDTFSYQRIRHVGEFLVINGEMILLKYIRVRTPRAHRVIRRFIKTACDLSHELKIDLELHPSVTSLLSIRLLGKKEKSSGRKYEKRKEDAQIRCL